MIRSGSVFAAALLTLALAGIWAHAQTSDAVSVTGILVDGGVQCRAMRGDDGALYTMRRVPALAQLKTGDRVKVTGTIAKASICQQGITIDSPQVEKTQ